MSGRSLYWWRIFWTISPGKRTAGCTSVPEPAIGGRAANFGDRYRYPGLRVALLKEDSLLGEFTVNVKTTHSQQLLPLIIDLLEYCRVERAELEGIAVAVGPGSFTGIRIGVSTARALAQGLSVPAVGVPTLEALAETVRGPGMLICPLLDARRGEVYGALYRRQDEYPYLLEEIVAPGAMKLELLLSHASAFDRPVIFLGEGLKTFECQIREELGRLALPAPLGLNRAALIAWRGKQLLESGADSSYERVLPLYLRLPEAERS